MEAKFEGRYRTSSSSWTCFPIMNSVLGYNLARGSTCRLIPCQTPRSR